MINSFKDSLFYIINNNKLNRINKNDFNHRNYMSCVWSWDYTVWNSMIEPIPSM